MAYMVGMVILLLMAASVCALLSQRVRAVTAMPDGKGLADMVADLLRYDAAGREERTPALMQEVLTGWVDGNAGLQIAVSKKVRLLQASQYLLFAAMVVFAVIVVVSVDI